jgi:hypothetical protein
MGEKPVLAFEGIAPLSGAEFDFFFTEPQVYIIMFNCVTFY